MCDTISASALCPPLQLNQHVLLQASPETDLQSSFVDLALTFGNDASTGMQTSVRGLELTLGRLILTLGSGTLGGRRGVFRLNVAAVALHYHPICVQRLSSFFSCSSPHANSSEYANHREARIYYLILSHFPRTSVVTAKRPPGE